MTTPDSERWCVVTGGRGFAARHLVEMLIRSDKWWVRIADLGPAIRLEPAEEAGPVGEALRSGRAVYVSADLRNRAQVITGRILTPNPLLFPYFTVEFQLGCWKKKMIIFYFIFVIFLFLNALVK